MGNENRPLLVHIATVPEFFQGTRRQGSREPPLVQPQGESFNNAEADLIRSSPFVQRKDGDSGGAICVSQE